MSGHYISLAVQLGPTSSCIARMEPEGPLVIPAEGDSLLLPSAVYGLETDIERAQSGDRDAELRAYKHSIELAGTVNELDRRQIRPRVDPLLENKAVALQGRIPEAGGIEMATDRDLSEMEAVHQELAQAQPDLYERRQKVTDEQGDYLPTLRTDVK